MDNTSTTCAGTTPTGTPLPVAPAHVSIKRECEWLNAETRRIHEMAMTLSDDDAGDAHEFSTRVPAWEQE